MSENVKEAKEDMPEDVPYIVYEGTMARYKDEIDRMERHNTKMFAALIVAIVLMFASNVGWLIYESLFDTITYDQDGQGINNINTGTQGDVTREPTSEDTETQER